jgi:hypothetical protein
MYDKCLRVEGSECVTARTRMFKRTGCVTCTSMEDTERYVTKVQGGCLKGWNEELLCEVVMGTRL